LAVGQSDLISLREIDQYLEEILMEHYDNENKVAYYWRSK
jgi:hypothetical protein